MTYKKEGELAFSKFISETAQHRVLASIASKVAV
jgi:hypothetical protein